MQTDYFVPSMFGIQKYRKKNLNMNLSLSSDDKEEFSKKKTMEIMKKSISLFFLIRYQ